MNQISKSLQECLEECLDAEWTPTSPRVKPSKRFSDLNPISMLVKAKANAEESHFCLIEACSGSGKSLCAADHFDRNVDDSIYFLFGSRAAWILCWGDVSPEVGLRGQAATYLRYEAVGDAFVGRTVTGLPIDSSEFAILPPHFKEALPMCMYAVAEFALASVLYHADFLRTNLQRNHPLWK